MRCLPINLRIEGKKTVVVGGGDVAARKVESVLAAGGDVIVIAPETAPALQELAERREIALIRRKYENGDLEGAFLVFAATDDPATNEAVAAEAAVRGVPVDVVSDPARSDFTSPAVVRQGDLLLTVSTSGASPALAAEIRRELEGRYGPEYAVALRLLAALRRKLLTENSGAAYNKSLFTMLVERDLPGLARDGRHAEIDRLLHEVAATSLADLKRYEDKE